MLRIIFINVCLFLYIGSVHSQSKTFTCYLIDSLNSPVTTASIIIKYKLGSITKSTYVLTDTSGRFTFNFEEKWSDLSLEINSIGYKPKLVQIGFNQSTLITIALQENTTPLAEVSILGKYKVVKRGDTVNFNLDAFSNNNETTVEDIIGKLPGFSVDVNGNISYNNKPIDRVLIEGDDLFDNNYKLLTKNLSAAVINEAQVIDKYSANSVLSGLSKGQEQVLNLKLRDKSKLVKEGNLSLAAGAPIDRFEVKANLITISSKFKAIALGSLNNIGINPFSFIESEDNQFRSIASTSLKAKRNEQIGNVNELFFNGIELQRNNFNNAKIGSVNFMYKPNKVLQVKGWAYLIHDVNTQKQANTIKEYTTSGIINSSNTNEIYKKQYYQGTNIEASYKPNASNQLTYNGKFDLGKIDFNNSILLENIYISQKLKTKRESIEQRLKFTRRLNELNGLDIEFLYNNNSIPQNLRLNKLVFAPFVEGLEDKISDDYLQKSNFPVSQFSAKAKFLGRLNKSNYSIGFGADFYRNRLNSSLSYFDIMGREVPVNISSINSDYLINQQKKYLEVAYNLKINSKLFFNNNGSISYEGLNVNEPSSPTLLSKSFIILENTTGISYLLNYKSNLSIINQFSQNLPPVLNLIPSYRITGYRNLANGILDLKKISNNNLSLNYSFIDYNKTRLLYNGTISYIANPNTYISDNYITPIYTVNSVITSNAVSNGVFYLSSRIEKYVSPISGNIILNLTASRGRYLNRVNEVVNDTKIKTANFELTYKSAWDEKFNLQLSSIVRLQSFNIVYEGTERSFSNIQKYFTSKLRVYYKLSEKLNFDFLTEYYRLPSHGANSELIFIDANVRYVLKKDKWIFDLMAKNLLNEQEIAFKTITSTQQFKLTPAYCLVKCYYRF